MGQRFKLKLILIFVISIFAFLFPYGKNYAVYGVAYTDDIGPDISDTSYEWYFTYYTDGDGGLAHINPNTNANFVQANWTVNETYGWHEWEYKGTKYVVVAAATREGLDELPNKKYPFITKQDNIHYFHYGSEENDWNYSVFKFNFADNGDTNTYYGIVLDTCELALDPSNPGWGTVENGKYKAKPANTQWLDVHVPLGYPEEGKYGKFNGQKIILNSDGIFSSNVGKTSSESKKDAIGEFFYSILTSIGDGVQILLNGFQNGKIDKDSKKITYTRGDIEANRKLNRQIHVADAREISEDDDTLTKEEEEDEEKYKTKKTVNILSTANNDKGISETIYTKDTAIPVMPVDMYSSAIGKVDGIDVDFFNTKSRNKNEFWKGIRTLVSGVSHIAMYIAAAMLLVMLIYRAILFIRSTLGDSPEGAYESRRIMDNFIKAILIISIIYFFMILMMALYKQILKLILNGNNSIYLIRVNVDGIYSFNTNIAGYFKYMTLNSNAKAALGYSFWYAIFQVFVNLAIFLILIYRMIVIAGLAIVAPFTAVYAMSGRVADGENNSRRILDLRHFMYMYITRLFAPLIIVILYRVAIFIA